MRISNIAFSRRVFWQSPIFCLLTKIVIACIIWFWISSFFFSDGKSIQPSIANAEQIQLPEYTIKAAFLYNFGKFVEWPVASDPSHYSPRFLNVCILGEDPFGEQINAIREKTLQSRIIRITYAESIEKMEEIGHCDILFISQSEEKHLSQIVEISKGYPILTIADTRGAVQLGVMINLIRVNDSVRFEINLKSAKQAGLKISSQLLKLATMVLE